ncbi:MAG TPA: NmrA family transcriptional regulator [Actinomycetes bacterium]|jgi:uncharacterized protein YbjT (DUF2867 family)|nr:NmrA family transcriptional regulator [Actinomycetota bacterium]HEX2156968.1 NmrA family transcriptional regulator [Actinomycetes bacterium]
MEPTTQQPTLVLGGTGKTGRRVVQRLEARGLPVRVGTPSGTPPFDWTDEATWPAGLDGVGSVYVTYYPDVAVPGAAEAIGTFADLAVARGVRRLVLLSGRGEEAARRSEQALVQSGADWTIVRSAFMFQNFNESFFLEPVRAGEVAFLADPGLAEPFIDADDIADVAVAALTDDRHVGQLYEVTGPRLLGWAEAVAEIAAAADRPIRYLPVSLEEYAALLTENQVPAEVVKMLTDVFTGLTEALDGRNAYLADGVQRALGRPPRDFRDFARDAAATGVWDGSAAAA